jgi:hypothetical protein
MPWVSRPPFLKQEFTDMMHSVEFYSRSADYKKMIFKCQENKILVARI